MKIILLGAPGAGKGTQAERIVDRYAIPHISTGDIFRKNIQDMTVLGQKVKQYMDSGRLVPDSVTVDIVVDRLQQVDCSQGFMLDGFPRNIVQATILDTITSIDKVINITVEFEILEARLTGRRVCPHCGRSYHISSMNSDICICGHKTVQRNDDQIQTVKDRLDVYKNQTKPLIDYYKGNSKFFSVDGMLSPNDVFDNIITILD